MAEYDSQTELAAIQQSILKAYHKEKELQIKENMLQIHNLPLWQQAG